MPLTAVVGGTKIVFVMSEIEKNIELPRGQYPVADMEVGDSFRVEREAVFRTRAYVYGYGCRNLKKFSVMRCSDGTYRCWRIE